MSGDDLAIPEGATERPSLYRAHYLQPRPNDGEFKPYGRAIDFQDAAAGRRYCQALTEKIGEGPGEEGDFHLVSADIENVAFGIIEDGERGRAGFGRALPADSSLGPMRLRTG